ncbi:hypothetical protein E1281_10190 [Actinomadura sp. KC345]|uniref:PGPGW domain-containing protein n=1 Tax=Actinomadura sp. KC345 TaxID=2530371 RepID=UPI0010445800|nr:PGPGW domain-containing protein [Actinomadura sp. KC345]TDC55879.1 hypothetical protein E1281_10190 [Actinomadura sp. KC345]
MTATERAESDAETAPAPARPAPVRMLRKIAVTIAGTGLIVAGVAMLVLPGPGIVAILAGVGLLGTEFPTARRVSVRLNGYARTAWHHIKTKLPRSRTASKR